MIINPGEPISFTGDTQIGNGPVDVFTISLTAGGQATATLTLYDNDSAAGEVEWYLSAAATTTESVTFPAEKPLRFKTACYADISGADARASINWE